MGIHSGPVKEVTDLNEQTNIAGAGINIAQRVMDYGDAGHILLSKRVAEISNNTPGGGRSCTTWEPAKSNTAQRSLVNLYSEESATRRRRKNFGQTNEEIEANGPLGNPSRFFRLRI